MKKSAAFVLVLLVALAVGVLVAAHRSAARDWLPFWGEAEPAATPTPARSASSPSAKRSSEMVNLPSFADIAEVTSPAVVNIATTQTVKAPDVEDFFGPFSGPGGPFGEQSPFDEFFRRFGQQGPREYKRQSLGSGFIIDSDGTIVTNHHVVAHAEEVIVRLASGKHEYKAKVIGSDSKTDIAVVKIDSQKQLPTLRLGDSSKLRIGDWVVAIGNPFGLEKTVTVGIVSATGRVIGQGPYDDFIQTDASINPGNSGGPLLNLSGEVVGIATAIFSQTGGNMGIGFAIPSNLSRSVVEQLKAKGKVVRGWLGVVIQDVNEELAKSFGLKEPSGALVADVQKGSPAEKAGFERGDVIVEYDGNAIEESHELPALVASTPIGRTVTVKVLRNGKEKELSVTVGEMPAETASAEGPERSTRPLEGSFGLAISPVTPDMAQRLGIPAGSGVLVRAVRSGSPAEEAGLRPGDVIQEVDRSPVKSVEDFQTIVRESKKDTLLLLVRRGDSTVFVALKGKKGG